MSDKTLSSDSLSSGDLFAHLGYMAMYVADAGRLPAAQVDNNLKSSFDKEK